MYCIYEIINRERKLFCTYVHMHINKNNEKNMYTN